MKYSLEELLARDGFEDGCGRRHFSGIKGIKIGSGAVQSLPELVASLGCRKPFLLADENTWNAAGERVAAVLDAAGIEYSSFKFGAEHLTPDEYAVGGAVMSFDRSCDLVIGIGSGVINDTGKILSATAGVEYIIVATAPSMDGYASATSSMERGGLKQSLKSRAPSYIVGDTDILREAPAIMTAAGVGDMAAKYISIIEWRMAHIILGEYYCDNIADMVLDALTEIVANADGLANRDPRAIESVMRGMVLAGVSMTYAGLSRPASGLEHYFSHVWDMRALEFGAPEALHGIQCGVGALLALRVYEQIRKLTPNREKALAHARSFDKEAWFAELRDFLGKGAEQIIAAEAIEKKYDPETHAARLESILAHWDELLAEIDKLPSYAELETLLRKVGSPTTPEELGHPNEVVNMSYRATKDIRFKYIASHLTWDLGEEITL